MAIPNKTYQVSSSQAEALVKFATLARDHTANSFDLRTQFEKIDFAYMREKNTGTEHNRAKAANNAGDKSRIQDITIPVVMPQVEAGVTYLSSVFLSGYPIFSVVSGPENIDEALQMDTLMAEHGIEGGWAREFNLFFRDALKYNLAFLEVAWKEKTVYKVEDDPLAVMKGTSARPAEVMWAGNTIRRLDPYNCFWDTRVTPAELHLKGEFAGYTELMSRTLFKQFVQDLPHTVPGSIKQALESGTGSRSAGTYYTPEINSEMLNALETGEFDWSRWALDKTQRKIEYRNMYEVSTIYARIIPQDFGLQVPARNTPQIWKLIVVNGSVLVFAERQTNAHNYLPILASQPLEDGLGYQTKSFAANVLDMQDASSAIMNSSLHARRRAVYDRMAYDPSRVNIADINSSNPIARIPVRPAAYGKPVGDAFFQFPFRDDQSATALGQVQTIMQFAEMVNGVNRSQQGLFTKGNKTRHEYQDVMSHSNARFQSMAQFIEAQVMVPIKEILKLNILQFAQGQTIFNRDNQQEVTVKPLDLRTKSLSFKVADGLLPTDKIIDADMMQVVLQIMGASPQLQAQFDLIGFMLYYFKTQGLRNLEQFRIQQPQPQIPTGVI